MTFPANELEQVLLAASRNETGMTSFLERLVSADVLVPSTRAADGSASLDIISLDNRAYVTVFTSPDQAAVAGNTNELAALAASTLIGSIPEHVGFAVNPGGDLGLPVYAETLRQLTTGSTRLTAGTRIAIGHPADEPSEFLEGLAAGFAHLPTIRAARRCWAAVGDAEPGLVLGIDIDPDSPDTRAAAVDLIGSASREFDTPFTVDAVFTNDRDTFTSWMHDNAEPFYRSA